MNFTASGAGCFFICRDNYSDVREKAVAAFPDITQENCLNRTDVLNAP
jgi:hypothetical protein